MIHSKALFLGVLAAVCSCINSASAVDLIEMTDANRAVLPLDLAKSLDRIQTAYASQFDFASIKDVKQYLDDCVYVNAQVQQSSDDDFDGKAKQVKEIMAEPSIITACSVKSQDISQSGFDALDTDYKADEHDYLSAKKTANLVAMKKTLEESAQLQLVLGKLLDNRINELAEAALAHAAENVNIFFDEKNKPAGFFDFNYMNYKSTCAIELIQPICRLARRSPNMDVQAIAADLADFLKIVEAHDEVRLNAYQGKSGVTMAEMKARCLKMQNGAGGFLKPIEMINKWVDERLMSSFDFEARLEVDQDLAFYNELHKLCQHEMSQ